MSGITIPAARVKVTVEDATLDLVCFKHLVSCLRDRHAAGRVRGYVEAVVLANPGLAGLELILPFGIEIALPEFTVSSSSTETVRLWD